MFIALTPGPNVIKLFTSVMFAITKSVCPWQVFIALSNICWHGRERCFSGVGFGLTCKHCKCLSGTNALACYEHLWMINVNSFLNIGVMVLILSIPRRVALGNTSFFPCACKQKVRARCRCSSFSQSGESIFIAGNTKRESITIQLTSCLTCSD